MNTLPEKIRKILMHGATAKDEQTYKAEFEGVVPMLQRRWENTDSEFVKSRLHNYQSEQPCEECKGKRLKPQALAVKIAGRNIQELTALTIARALEFFSNLKLDAIAEECGFSSSSDFCRVFKTHHHVSPDAWRKKHLPAYEEPAATRK